VTTDITQAIADLQSDDTAMQLQAADTLGSLGEAAQEAVPALKAALTGDYEPLAVTAAYTLAYMGDAGRAALLDVLTSASDIRTTENAAYGLSAVGAPALDGLIEALTHPAENTRAGAAFAFGETFALGELPQAAQDAVPALIALLQDESDYVRRNVVEALGTIGGPLSQVVPALMQALDDADGQVRFTAILSLSRIGAKAGQAVPVLGRALHDDNRYVRANAVDALARIGTPEANQVLVHHLQAARWCPSTTPESTF
jgi:HEAT repeat protein